MEDSKKTKWTDYGYNGSCLSRITDVKDSIPDGVKAHPRMGFYISKNGEVYLPVENKYLYFDASSYSNHTNRGVSTHRISLPIGTIGIHRALTETYIKYPLTGNDIIRSKTGSMLDITADDLYLIKRIGSPYEKICKRCGNNFIANSATKRFCDDCRKAIVEDKKKSAYAQKHPIDDPYILLYAMALKIKETDFNKDIDPDAIRDLIDGGEFSANETTILNQRSQRKSLQSIGDSLGLSKQRVEQIEKKALGKLAELIKNTKL